ncbi:MAG: PASTA domain-containing protein [Candidatus Cloacimonetes bacterium]|nr:PASTA domain-containing protein [Candidatus Cloacimonadota bacterium]
MRHVILLLFVALCLFACNQKAPEIQAPRPFGMPTLVDKSFDEAQAICGEWGMTLAVMEERFDGQKSAATVMSQWPKPGDNATTNTVAVVVLSKRPERVRIPNLHKLTVAQAEARLQAAGLRMFPRMTYRFNGNIAKGRILDFNPGQQVYAGSAVEVMVSKGPAPTGDSGVNSLRLGD